MSSCDFGACPIGAAETGIHIALTTITYIYAAYLFKFRDARRGFQIVRATVIVCMTLRLLEFLPREAKQTLVWRIFRGSATGFAAAACFQWCANVIETNYKIAGISDKGPLWATVYARSHQALLLIAVPLLYGLGAMAHLYCNLPSTLVMMLRYYSAFSVVIPLLVCHIIVHKAIAEASIDKTVGKEDIKALRRSRWLTVTVIFFVSGFCVTGVLNGLDIPNAARRAELITAPIDCRFSFSTAFGIILLPVVFLLLLFSTDVRPIVGEKEGDPNLLRDATRCRRNASESRILFNSESSLSEVNHDSPPSQGHLSSNSVIPTKKLADSGDTNDEGNSGNNLTPEDTLLQIKH